MATLSRKTYIGLLTAALAIGGSSLLVVDSAIAHTTGSTRMDPDRHVERMAKALNASADQKAKLLAIAKAAQTDIKPLHEQIQMRMEAAMTQSKEVLTTEQRAQWDEKMKSRHTRMREHSKKHD